MTVSMWMARSPVTTTPKTSITEAAALMARRRVRRLLVVESHGGEETLAGILCASDVLHVFPPKVNPFAIMPPDEATAPFLVGEIMQRQVLTTTPDTPIEQAAALMQREKIGGLPVVRGHVLAGIITESDIFRAFVSLFGTERGGARITFDASKGEDVFGLMARLAGRDGVQVISLMWTKQGERPVCVARVTGHGVDKLLEDLWASGHTVLNVLRFPAA